MLYAWAYDLLQDVPRCGYMAKEELRLHRCPQHRLVSVPLSPVSHPRVKPNVRYSYSRAGY